MTETAQKRLRADYDAQAKIKAEGRAARESAARRALRNDPDLSNKTIAARTGADQCRVAELRAEMGLPPSVAGRRRL